MTAKPIPPRAAACAIAFVAAATLIGAWIFQYGFDIRPCPLCLEQRYAYYLIIPLGFFLAGTPLPSRILAAGLAVVALAALANAILGGYHAGVEWGFWAGPKDCSGPLTELGGSGGLLGQIQSIKIIRCDEVQWRFLGLSLAGYNVLISLLMAALAVAGLKSGRRI